METESEVREKVQEKYGAAARQVRQTNTSACCNPAFTCCDPITSDLYNAAEKGELPEAAVLASLGCGNPTALIELKAGRDGSGSWLWRRH